MNTRKEKQSCTLHGDLQIAQISMFPCFLSRTLRVEQGSNPTPPNNGARGCLFVSGVCIQRTGALGASQLV
jgi:hypothetical protein